MKIKKMGLEKRKVLDGYFFISPWLAGFILFSLYPLLHTAWLSFCEVQGVSNLRVKFTGISNYINAFVVDVNFLPRFLTIINDTIINTVLIIIFSLFIAILLNYNIRAKGFFRGVFFLPVILGTGYVMQQLLYGGVNNTVMVNGIGIPQQIFIYLGPTATNIVNAFLSRLTLIFWRSGVQIVLFLAGLQGISDNLYEAARCDGATEWESFWKITLPLISPVILINIIFTIIDSFTDINNNIMQYINEVAFSKLELGYAAALGFLYFVFIFIVIAIVFIVSSRHVFYAGER
ncbi:ABC-type sugar transport system, permease component [Caldanaerobius fijiensis DSM 17918]|uniref:ABC-type sugar transport system, permease component n=1 Tax=Caldanaerobius fijiensis DSM 17918 TaxID=1121256 RepID=A0A1M4WJV2_9THEO|nr:sugar ABC transporter permease [Caldanaerobius fijiensis]SHE81486.1 ABC-type sugar transport system, permease component [Caldanaerobius fijiensis DSM 17918]